MATKAMSEIDEYDVLALAMQLSMNDEFANMENYKAYARSVLANQYDTELTRREKENGE